MLLKISDIRFDSQYVVREIDNEIVKEYAEALSEGKQFPRPVLFFDGQFYWPGDGRHRTQARLQAGHADIEVDIRNGSERDAYLFGVEANQRHGLRLSRADKRKAVELMLRDQEWSKWSSAEIAKKCGVGHTMVSNMKASIPDISHLTTYVKEVVKCEVNDEEDEVVYVDPKAGVKKKKSPANKRKQRATHSNTPPSTQNKGKPFSWKEFYADFGRLFRQIGKLQAVPPYDAQYLESQLIVWKDTFKRMYAENTGKEPEKEVAELCTSERG